MRRLKIIFISFILFALFFLGLFLFFFQPPSARLAIEPPHHVGEFFPPFSIFSSSQISTEDFSSHSLLTQLAQNKRWGVVHFWASWCKVCVAELPRIAQFAQETRDIAFHYIIRYTDMETSAELEKYQHSFTHIVYDRQGKAGFACGIVGVPETFLLTPQGKIVEHYRGPLSEATVEKALYRMTTAENKTIFP